MRILVTGATGFIGGNLIDALLRQGHEVFTLVRTVSNVSPLAGKPVTLVYGDITDRPTLKPLETYRFDAVYHCAAFVSDKDLARLYKVNVAGTEAVCAFCMAVRVPRLIFISSVAVVSGNEAVPLVEDMPYKATNLYGLSKMEAEKLVLGYRKQGLNAAIIRPSMVYGPGEPHAMPWLLRLLRFGVLPVLDGGRNKMHLAYIGNVVNALVEALTNDAFLQGAFFIADDEILTTRRIFETLAQGLGSLRPVVLPPGFTPLFRKIPYIDRAIGFFTKDRVYDISRIRATGYTNNHHAVESLRFTASSWISRQWK